MRFVRAISTISFIIVAIALPTASIASAAVAPHAQTAVAAPADTPWPPQTP